ncbi:MAG: hypothetical protein QOF13_1933 [Solirubrobacterales bacterium]|nr:hypothetical protein [Solirubrobacterales bacterium]
MALHGRRALGLSLACFGLFFFAAPISRAAAEFEIPPGGFSAALLDGEGNPLQLAGSHPDRLEIDFALNLGETTARDLAFELPPGLGVNAAAVPACSRELVAAEEECPAESRVGSLELVLSGGSKLTLPLFELESAAGEPVAIGSQTSFDSPVRSELRSGDFGITFEIDDLPDEPISEGHLALWGIPADHQEGTSIPRRALLSAPSSCGPLSFGFRARSREEGAEWLTASSSTPALSGCESLAFEPGVGLQLSDPVVDSPTGLRLEMTLPEVTDPSLRAQAQIRTATIQMPSGLAFSPGGAASLTACSDAQLGAGSTGDAHCPASSRVGSVELLSPAIAGSVTGTIYLGEERPGQRFRVFVVARAAGSTLKFVGALGVAQGDGRLSATLRDLPPLSISRIAMSFDSGPGAMFASPLTCGEIDAVGRFEPYGGGPTKEAAATATIGAAPAGPACAGGPPFSPQLLTASSTLSAGRSTTFSSTVSRRQGEQLPARLSVVLPAGLTARLGAVQVCPAPSVASASCPPASRIGGLLAQIGSGPSSVTLHGGLYLTAGYRRAPFGMLIALPGAIGPFDLGTISLRGAAELDQRTGRLTISTDRLPSSVEGVSVRFQRIGLEMDRPGFVHNPTSCAPTDTKATIEAQSGATATVSSPFAARACGRLRFAPATRMTLLGSRQLHRGGRPSLRTTVRVPAGNAALRSMKMSLPPELEFTIGGLREICSRHDAAAGECPAGSRIGRIEARTALLSEPLRGAIYAAQPNGRGLPDISASLAAAGIRMGLRGETTNRDGNVTFSLAGLPDVPISSLSMQLAGAGGGVFSLATAPCAGGDARRLESRIAARAQNGARRALHVRIGMKVRCGSAAAR